MRRSGEFHDAALHTGMRKAAPLGLILAGTVLDLARIAKHPDRVAEAGQKMEDRFAPDVS